MAGWPGSLVPRIFANDQACTPWLILFTPAVFHAQDVLTVDDPGMCKRDRAPKSLQCDCSVISGCLSLELWDRRGEAWTARVLSTKWTFRTRLYIPFHLTCFCETLCRHLQPPPHTQTLDLGRSGTLIVSLSFQNTPVTSDAFKSRLISHNPLPSQTLSPSKFRGSQDQSLPSGLFSLLPAWTILSLVHMNFLYRGSEIIKMHTRVVLLKTYFYLFIFELTNRFVLLCFMVVIIFLTFLITTIK